MRFKIQQNSTNLETPFSSSSSSVISGWWPVFFQAENIQNSTNITVASTKFTNCFAQGVSEANNVFVIISGGAIHFQKSGSLCVHNRSISLCEVRNAFSTFFGHPKCVCCLISWLQLRNNFDSSSTGTIFLQQLKDNSSARLQ
jgi:hypothetical protein